MAKTRLHYFDMMKGIAIFMVVMGHVLTMCIREIDQSFLFKIIGEVHMPLFFFISGYFCYKISDSGKLMSPDLWKRFKQLIVPFVVLSGIWIYYFPHSGLQSPFDSTWHGLYFNASKNGYWFTLTLFEIMLVYAALTKLLSGTKKIATDVLASVAAWIFIGYISLCLLPDNIVDLLGLKLVFQYFPVFMAGYFAKKHCRAFNKAVSNHAIYTASLILFGIMVYYVCYYWKFPSILSDETVVYSAKPFLHVSLAIIAVAVVKPWGEKAFADTKGHWLARMWEKIGKESLAIYMLHYFFLFPMSNLQEPLRKMSLGFVPTFVVSMATAGVIIALVMAANHFIKKSRLLSLLLTGKA